VAIDQNDTQQKEERDFVMMIGIVMLCVTAASIGFAVKATRLDYPEHPDQQWTARMQYLAARRAEIERMTGFDQLKAMEVWLAEFDHLNQQSARFRNRATYPNKNIVTLHRQL